MIPAHHSQNPTHADRLQGCLYGALVGDALGVPYEFKPPGAIPPYYQIEMTPPEGFQRSHAAELPGTWSDDGALGLCLLASGLEHARLDPADIGKRFVRYVEDGYMTPDGRNFGTGGAILRAVERIRSGTPALKAGDANEQTMGNGSLMRLWGMVLWHDESDSDLVRDAMTQSRITHAHPRVLACCAQYAAWLRRLLLGDNAVDAWKTAAQIVIGCAPPLVRSELNAILEYDDRAIPEVMRHPLRGHIIPRGTSHVVDTLLSARALLFDCTSYEEVVRCAVLRGNDTDTTACVAGAAAGALWGLWGLPDRWVEGLRAHETPARLAGKLLHARA